jgi:hypothetical protein
MKACFLGNLGLIGALMALGCTKSGAERVMPVGSASQPTESTPIPVPKSAWPGEPSPPLAGDTATLSAANTELGASKSYKAILEGKAPKAKRDAFLREVGNGIAALNPDFAKAVKAMWQPDMAAKRNQAFAEMAKASGLDAELAKALFALFAVALVEGTLPSEFRTAVQARLAEGVAKPHAGLWSKEHDLTALAVYLTPGNAIYLRELVAARASDETVDWEGKADAYRPWLSRERDALQLLSQFTPLNEVETARMNEIRASKLGDIEKVDLDELLATYKRNEVRGDDKFKGHSVQVRGTVHEIAKDALGNTFLRMGSAGLVGGFHCKMNPAFLKQASKVDGGSTATVRGKVVGLVLKNVVAGDCEVQ